MTDSPSRSAEAYEVPAGRTVDGRLAPPASKSFSHRYLSLALLSRRPLVVERLLDSEDLHHFRRALDVCGIDVQERAGDVTLKPRTPSTEGGEIHCGNAGTMFRFLVAVLATQPGTWRVDGTPRLRERTVAPLIEALRRLGAEIRCLGEEGFAPLEIRGGSLGAGRTRLDAGQSSQFLSAILLAAQRAPGEVEVEVEALTSAPYLDLTLAAIRTFGGKVERIGSDLYRTGPAPLEVDRVRVEGDFSAACYPAAAAALTGGRVVIEGVREDSLQGDRAFFSVLERMGAGIRWREGEVEVRGHGLAALEEDFSSMPDQVPTLAALAPFARGVTRITNVAHLRIKESDRLHAMATELQRLGVPVTEGEDSLTIEGTWADGPPPGEPVEVETYDDHRIAMSLALTGLRRPGVRVLEPHVVGKSYPAFWNDLEALLVPCAESSVRIERPDPRDPARRVVEP